MIEVISDRVQCIEEIKAVQCDSKFGRCFLGLNVLLAA